MKQDSGDNKHSNISDDDPCLFFNVFINIFGENLKFNFRKKIDVIPRWACYVRRWHTEH